MKIGDAKKVQILGGEIQSQLQEEGLVPPCPECTRPMKAKSRPDNSLYWRCQKVPCKGSGMMMDATKSRIGELAAAKNWDGSLSLLF